MTPLTHRWLPSLTLFAWSAVMLYFHLSGQVRAFLIPSFRPMVLISGLVLLVMAVGMCAMRPAGGDCCGDDETCAHTATGSALGRILTFSVLLVPLAAAAAFSPDGFGVTALLNRGVATDASALVRKAAPPAVEPPLPTHEGTAPARSPAPESALDYLERTPEGYVKAEVVDFLYAAQDPGMRKDFEGQTVSVVGQLMPQKVNNPRGDRFQLMRMFMTCCAADARPVGVTVESPRPPGTPELSWVRVVGHVEFPVQGGRMLPVLKASAVEPTNPPEESMLF